MLHDTLGRPLANLRLSVTDRCNLRCQYCMPEKDYVWLPKDDILHFEEIDRLVDVFLDLGVRKVRLTGGEPLLRKDLPVLVERLAAKPRVEDLAMTTNGVLLAPMAADLKRAGLHRITVSLDTLQPERFVKLTRYDELDRVLKGIEAAASVFPGFKIDMVVIKGTNDDEVVPMVEFAQVARGGGALHRIHGRRRRDALEHGSGDDARRHPGDARSPLRRHRGVQRASRRRRPIASGCPMAPSSASSRRPRIPSVVSAIGAV